MKSTIFTSSPQQVENVLMYCLEKKNSEVDNILISFVETALLNRSSVTERGLHLGHNNGV